MVQHDELIRCLRERESTWQPEEGCDCSWNDVCRASGGPVQVAADAIEILQVTCKELTDSLKAMAKIMKKGGSQ